MLICNKKKKVRDLKSTKDKRSTCSYKKEEEKICMQKKKEKKEEKIKKKVSEIELYYLKVKTIYSSI